MYEEVRQMMGTMLSKVKEEDKTDRAEAQRRILRGAFAHQSNAVLGAPLAAFLTRRQSRFMFSHKTAFCPLRDICAILDDEEVAASVRFHNDIPFLQNGALDYICRPVELEGISVFEFFRKWEVVRVTEYNEDDVLRFDQTHRDHPAYIKDHRGGKRCIQGVRMRTIPKLLKVYTYDFPDTDLFGGNIMDDGIEINAHMESYARLANTLFVPFRKKSDIQDVESYTNKFRNAVNDGLINDEALSFLQNIQDVKINSFRCNTVADELQRCTEAYVPPTDELLRRRMDDDLNEEEEDDETGPQLDAYLAALNSDIQPAVEQHDVDPVTMIPKKHNMETILEKGSHAGGFEHIAAMKPVAASNDATEQLVIEGTNGMDGNIDTDDNGTNIPNNPKPSIRELTTVAMTHTTRRQRSFADITKTANTTVIEANGSAASIIEWARAANLDREQRRAFEIIVASFVLTFYKDASIQPETIPGYSGRFRKLKRDLERLAETRKRRPHSLVCFLHGPGGSGKSTAIELVMLYAKEYCDKLPGYSFTERTIVVTAMSGVAATLIRGDTLHRSVYLNQVHDLTHEQIEIWEETRLLLVDEISFANKTDYEDLHRRLRVLKQRIGERYGGLDIVFSGDLRQLEPVGDYKKAIYKKNCSEFRDWMNCYIELRGLHRFKNDLEWGRLLERMRDGKISQDDIALINTRVVSEEQDLPDNIRYATYNNRDRDSINTAVFRKHCREEFIATGDTKSAVAIYSDGVTVRDGSKKYVNLRNCMPYWTNCGEDDVKMPRGKGRFDPVLRIYRGCRVMLPTNRCVSAGQANGTMATVEKVVLKPGASVTETIMDDNIPLRAVTASNVGYVQLRHADTRIIPTEFRLAAEQHSFRANISTPWSQRKKHESTCLLSMRAMQIPFIINNATTGHKLQGAGVETLFVHEWHYGTNWPYVMLSRVTTMKGLYLRMPLSDELSKYEMPKRLEGLLKFFREERSPSYWADDEYDDLFDLN